MTKTEFYKSKGTTIKVINQIKNTKKLSSMDEAFEFWQKRQEQKRQKKEKLAEISQKLSISQDAVYKRMYRRGLCKIDNVLLTKKETVRQKCEKLGLGYHRVKSVIYYHAMLTDEAIQFCLDKDKKKGLNNGCV